MSLQTSYSSGQHICLNGNFQSESEGRQAVWKYSLKVMVVMEIDVAVQTGFLFILFSQFQLSFGYLQTAQKNKPQLFLSLNPSINCIDVYHTLRAVSEIIFLKHQSSLLVDEKKNPPAKHIFSGQNVCI